MTDYLWDKSGADPDVERLEDLLSGFRAGSQPPPRRRRWARAAIVISMSVMATGAAAMFVLVPKSGAWKVASLAGSPHCGARNDQRCAELRPGEWLETGANDRARLAVADIGHMDIAEGSSLRLIKSGKDGHRVELRRGAVSVKVVAPPRLLIVDTPATAAVDLGCAYTLAVDADGATRIEVTSGYVALESPTYQTLVPAGWIAVARRGEAPSLPIRVDAPDALRIAALQLGHAQLDITAMNLILRDATARDAITVWHIIARVPDGEIRERVVTRLEQLAKRPDGVSREAVLRLDRTALETWSDAILETN